MINENKTYKLDILSKVINVNKIGALLAEQDSEWNNMFEQMYCMFAKKALQEELIDQKTYDFFYKDRLDSHSPCSVKHIESIRDNTFSNKYKIPSKFIRNE